MTNEVFNQVELEEVDVPILLPHEVLHAIAMAGPEQVGMCTCFLPYLEQQTAVFVKMILLPDASFPNHCLGTIAKKLF